MAGNIIISHQIKEQHGPGWTIACRKKGPQFFQPLFNNIGIFHHSTMRNDMRHHIFHFPQTYTVNRGGFQHGRTYLPDQLSRVNDQTLPRGFVHHVETEEGRHFQIKNLSQKRQGLF